MQSTFIYNGGSLLQIFITIGLSMEIIAFYQPDTLSHEPNGQIKSTFDLLEQQRTFEAMEKGTLILGNNGAVKTALVQILTVDNTKLTAVEKGGQLRIEADDKKIGHSSLLSKTIYPELVIDPMTNTTFYDCPGFSSSLNTTEDIAASYFTNKLTQSLDNIKLIVVVEHNSLKLDGNRYDFMELLRHMIDFLKDIPKYIDSIVLIATNVENTYKKGKLVNDKALIESIIFFLRELRVELVEMKVMAKKNFARNEIKKMIELVDIFLTPGKISLSRDPEDEGKISDDELIQKGKKLIQAAIETASFSPVSETDFGYTLGSETKIDIRYLLEAATRKSEAKIYDLLFQFWENKRKDYIESHKNWTEIRNTLDFDLQALSDFTNKLNTANISSSVAVFIRNAGFSVGIDIPYSLVSSAIRYDGYVDFFHLVGNTAKDFKSSRYFPGLDKVVQFTTRYRLWYGFLLNLLDYLESYEVQVNREWYRTSDFLDWDLNSEGIFVSQSLFMTFFDKVADKTERLRHFELVTNTSLTDLQLLEINEVIFLTLRNDPFYVCNKSNSMTVTGNYVILRSAYTNSLCVSNSLHVSATSTIFIDEDIWTVGGKFSLSLIAPKVVVVGKSVISCSKMLTLRSSGFTNDLTLTSSGAPGVISTYLLDSDQGCLSNCISYVGKSGEQAKFDGVVDTIERITEYKTQIHSSITSLNFDTVTNFWKRIDNSRDLQGFSNTLEFAKELLSIVSESHTGKSLSKKVLSIRYSSLIQRLEVFSQSFLTISQVAELDCSVQPCNPRFKKTVNESTIFNKRALFTIYTAAKGQINFLKETEENNVVADISSFLKLSIKALETAKEKIDLKSISEGMTKLLQDYNEGIEKEIKQASSFISKNLKPAIDKLMKKLSKEVEEIIKVIKEKEAETIKNIHSVTSARNQLADNLKLKQATGAANIAGNFLGVLGLGVGDALKGLVHSITGTVESFHPDVSALPGQIVKIGAEAAKLKQSLTSYLRRLPDEIDIDLFFDDVLESLPLLPNGTEGYQTVKSNLEKHIKAYRLEISQDNFDYTKLSGLKTEIKNLIIKLSRETTRHRSGREGLEPLDVVQLVNSGINSAASWSTAIGSIPLYIKDMEKLQGEIDKGDKVIKELKEVNDLYFQMKQTVTDVVGPMLNDINFIISLQTTGLKNISSVAALVKGWQTGKAIRTLRHELQVLIASLNIEGPLLAEVIFITNELEAAMQTVTGIQDKAATLRGNQNLAKLIHGLTSPQYALAKIPGELGTLVQEIELKIKTTSALWFYNQCKSAFVQHVFPFADLFENDLYLPDELISKDTNFAIDKALTKLQELENHIETQKAQITNRLDSFQFKGSFWENSNYTGPFYTWKSANIPGKIENFLSGKEIYLDASVIHSPLVDVIKFRKVNLLLNLRSENKSFVQDFHSALSHFKLRLTHSGNSNFRFQGKYYMIPFPLLDFEYTLQFKEDGSPFDSNIVYEKLGNGDNTLSPYTLWKFSLTSINQQFDVLKPFVNSEIDLVLVGDGTYVDPLNAGVTAKNFHVDKYYQEVKSMEGLASAELKPAKVQSGTRVNFVRKGRHIWASTSRM